jgi:hypothetical protein
MFKKMVLIFLLTLPVVYGLESNSTNYKTITEILSAGGLNTNSTFYSQKYIHILGEPFIGNQSDGFTNLAGYGYTIDLDPPKIYNFTLNLLRKPLSTININATIKDDISGISSAIAEITYPDGTSTNLTMLSGESLFYANFTDTSDYGTYAVKIYVNDSRGNSNTSNTEGFNIFKTHPIEAIDDEVIVDTNLTARRNAEINNTNNIDFTDADLTIDIPDGWYNITPNTLKVNITSGNTENKSVNLTRLTAFEDSYIPTYEKVEDTTATHTYISYINITEGNLTPNLPITYIIPKDRLTNWNNRLTTEATVDADSNITLSSNGEVNITVGTGFSGNYSLTEGLHTFELKWTTKKYVGAAGGGGRRLNWSITPLNVTVFLLPEEEAVINVTIYNYEFHDIVVTISTKMDIGPRHYYTVGNRSNRTISFRIKGTVPNITEEFKFKAYGQLGSIIDDITGLIAVKTIECKPIGAVCKENSECCSLNCIQGLCQEIGFIIAPTAGLIEYIKEYGVMMIWMLLFAIATYLFVKDNRKE